MIYLSGAIRKEVLGRSNVGVILTPMMGNRVDLTNTPWGADTGCFNQPEKYDTFRYLAWLDKLKPYWPTCLFATAPDRVGNAAWTLEISAGVLPLIRQRVPAALVAQNGIERLSIPWDTFDVMFVGGTNEWKLSELAYELMYEAHKRGKWVHNGRVNSLRRLRTSAQAGCDSADGTFLAFGPDANLPKLERWLMDMNQERHLPLWQREGTA